MKLSYNGGKKPHRRSAFLCVRLEDRTVPATIFAVDTASNLLTFDSATPGTIVTNQKISGLGAGESVLAIDLRPATGGLYALGVTDDGATRTGQIYTINPATAAATAVGTPFSTTLADVDFWGFDFNPNVDRIRITNRSQQNLRVNPDTGALVATDTNLSTSGINGVAYDNGAGENATTTLYAYNFDTDTFGTIGGLNGTPSPNGGVFMPIGNTGIVALDAVYMDIEAGTNIGRFTANGQLFTINLTTGAATLIGTIGGTPTLRGMTTASTAITIGGTGNDDTVVVTATDANSGSYTLNGGTPVTFSGITSFSFIAGAGADKLTINNPAAGVFAPVSGIIFHGGGSPGDVVENLGGTANSGSFTPGTSASNGVLTQANGGTTQTITLNGISGFTDTVAESTFDINGSAGDDTFSFFASSVVSGVQLSQVIATPGGLAPFDIFYGNKPTTNVLGQDGADLFVLNGTSNLTNLNGGNQNDRLLFDNATGLATLSGGSFDGGADTDAIDYGNTPTAVRVNLGLTNNMTVEMDGLQENPAIATGANASGTVSYSPGNFQVSIALTVNNLFNTITDFHIHLNPTGINGGIIVPIGPGVFAPTGTPGQFTVNTSVTLPELNEAALLGGHTYLNIHTDVNKGGEIRGQILAGGNTNLLGNGFASGTASISSVENAVGTNVNDSLVGSFVVNNLNGAGGNDIIVGGPGADTLVGGDGNDVLVWNNGDGSDIMDGGNDADTVQVNGNGNSEVFSLTDNGSRAEFKRTGAGPFNLDIGTTESLRLNANSGDDSFTVTGLNSAGSGIATVQGFGFNGNDTFITANSSLTGGLRYNGHLGSNSLNVTDSTVDGAVNNGNGITGNGLLGEFLSTVDLDTNSFSNNAQNGVRLDNVGDVNVNALTTTGNTGFGVSLGTATNVEIGGGSPAPFDAGSGIQLTGPLTYHAQVDGPTPGTQYDQIVASKVSLGNAALDFDLGFTPAPGQTFTLIDNTGVDPVTGTFAGLPEGAVINQGGQVFVISYVGGPGGNDVVVTSAVAPVFTSATRFSVDRGVPFAFTVTTVGIPPASVTISGGLPTGVTYVNNNDGTGTLSGMTSESGTFDLLFNADNGSSTVTLQSFKLIVVEHFYAVGAGPGRSPDVNVYAADGTLRHTFTAYDPRFTGGVTVATADFNNDGIDDIITGAASNGGPHVKVFDGKNLNQLASFFAYSASFTGGIFVAAGDINDDGQVDIITGANAGGGPHVKAFSGLNLTELRSFFAYAAAFTGGVRVAAGDVNNDGKADIITGAGPGGGPHVEAFSGADNKLLRSFFAYDAAFTGGVYVASGDVNGDGTDDIITGAGAGGGPHVQAFDGTNLVRIYSFFAYDSAFKGGVRVGADDLDNDGRADLITGAGPGGGPHVEVFNDGPNHRLQSFFAFDPSFMGGVYVG